MTETIAFDNEKYLKEQTASILDRVEKSGNKLYLEFGGQAFLRLPRCKGFARV